MASILMYVPTGNFLLLFLHLCCTTNQRSILFGYFLHPLAQSSWSPPGFSGVSIAEEVDIIGDKRSGDNTMIDVQILLEALSNWYLRSACFITEAFSGKKAKLLVFGLLSRSVGLLGFLNYRMSDLLNFALLQHRLV